MSGTYIEGESQVLSGVYTVIKAAVERVTSGNRGVVTYPFTANWGPVNTLELILGPTSFNDKYNVLGTTLTANKIAKHAFKGKPQLVLAYRMATSSAATGKLTLKDSSDATALKVETKYPSSRAFAINVKDAVTGGKTLELVENSILIYSITVATIAELYDAINASDYLVATEKGTGLPANVSGSPLAGGNDGSTVTATEYAAYLDAVEANGTPNAIALDGVTDEAILTTFKAWVMRVRDEGCYITGVRGGGLAWDSSVDNANTVSKACNYRGMVNVGLGLDGYSSADIAIFVAARIASIALNMTLTDEVVPYTAVNKKLKKSERITAKQKGTLIFVMEGTNVIIDEGVNTLTTPGTDEVAEMGKIRVNNAIDTISLDLEIFGNEYKKTRSNTAEARQTYAAAVTETYFKPLATKEVIKQDFSYEPDPDYYGDAATKVAKIDEAFFYGSYWPVDSMEKIYQKLGVKF